MTTPTFPSPKPDRSQQTVKDYIESATSFTKLISITAAMVFFTVFFFFPAKIENRLTSIASAFTDSNFAVEFSLFGFTFRDPMQQTTL